jgi:hypothetical protein
MNVETLHLLTLSVALLAHLFSTVWWAASVSRRVDYIEKWITHHEHTAERLAALEQRIDHLHDGIQRIELFLHQRA